MLDGPLALCYALHRARTSGARMEVTVMATGHRAQPHYMLTSRQAVAAPRHRDGGGVPQPEVRQWR